MFIFRLDNTFGPHLLQLCNRALFECLALNLYCLRGEQGALTAVINNRIVSTVNYEVSHPLTIFTFISFITHDYVPTVSHSPEDHVS